LSEKPEKSATKLDLESNFAEIQTQLRVNNRPAYVCPQEYSPETLDAAFDALWNAEKTHATAAREHRFKFVSKKEEGVSEDKMAEFTDSYKHFDKDNDGALDRLEFKAALSAMSIPVRDDAALDALMNQVSGGSPTISLEQWIRYNTELATDKDTPEQIKASFKCLADDKETISADNLRVPPLSAEDVEYLSGAMPQAATGGLDYSAFVDSSFVSQ
jgi:Ca2+-binding EF-hand superfamily protein